MGDPGKSPENLDLVPWSPKEVINLSVLLAKRHIDPLIARYLVLAVRDLYFTKRCNPIEIPHHIYEHSRRVVAELFVLPRPSQTKRKIPGGLRRRVFERDAYRCRYCGSHLNLAADHIIPECQGGPTTFENLQTLCHSCNSRKGSR